MFASAMVSLFPYRPTSSENMLTYRCKALSAPALDGAATSTGDPEAAPGLRECALIMALTTEVLPLPGGPWINVTTCLSVAVTARNWHSFKGSLPCQALVHGQLPQTKDCSRLG